MPSPSRYTRQIQVDKIGAAGQRCIEKASVLLVGIGGLGCQVGTQLARAGIGSITVVDHDVIDVSNLHRQILFHEDDIGQPKASVAARELRCINSNISITSHCARISLSNLANFASKVDVIIDAADNFVTSYLLSDYCFANRIPLVSASVNSTFGHVGVFCGTQAQPAPSVRALFPRLPAQQTSCESVGVTGPSVGMIASLQTQEILKVILGDDAQLLGKLLYLDLWSYQQHIVDFSTAAEPVQNQVELIDQSNITANDIVVDVRNSDEVVESPLAFGSALVLHIPLNGINSQQAELKQHQQRIVCVCKSGQRALVGAQQLLNHGLEQVAALVPS